MNLLEPTHAALKSLRANKLRSALTTLGIIIGVAAVIIVVSLVRGLERSILKQVERAGSQTLFVRPLMPQDVPFDEYQKVRNRDLTLADFKALQRAVPQITQVTPLAITNSELKANGRTTSSTLVMTDDTYLEANDIALRLGRNFVTSDLRLMIEKRFQELAIQLPFPQRDVRLATERPLQVEWAQQPAPPPTEGRTSESLKV